MYEQINLQIYWLDYLEVWLIKSLWAIKSKSPSYTKSPSLSLISPIVLKCKTKEITRYSCKSSNTIVLKWVDERWCSYFCGYKYMCEHGSFSIYLGFKDKDGYAFRLLLHSHSSCSNSILFLHSSYRRFVFIPL